MKITTENFMPAFKPFKLVIEVENQDEVTALTTLTNNWRSSFENRCLPWPHRQRMAVLCECIDHALSQREV